jgi:peptide/nickel transport system permease protein
MPSLTVKKRLRLFEILAAAVLLTAMFAASLAPFDPSVQNLQQALQGPSLQHLLGTDNYGRDLLSRVILGTRTSILATLGLVGLISLTGTCVGACCGYVGGKLDAALMRLSDVFLAFPGLVFAIAVAGVWGGGVLNAVLALAAISWPKYARLVRGQVLVQKEQEYVQAAKLDGAGWLRILTLFILPNVVNTVLITAILDFGTMLMEIAGLSFLGLGAQPPTPEWGSMMSGGRSLIQTSPWIILAPGGAIFLTVGIFNLLGDTLRDYLDPQQKLKEE